MGVTQSTYDSYRSKKNLAYKDVKNITKDEAKQIYYEGYWQTSGADKIDDPKMAIAVFDTAVLHGPQKAKTFYQQSGEDLDKFLQFRKQSYDRIIANNPSQKVFYQGWNNRVNNLKKYTEKIPTTVLKGGVEMNVGNDNERIYTAEEIGAMTPEAFRKNEQAINEQLRERGVPRENQAKQAVESGSMIWVDGYTRADGTEVKGYYRAK